MFIKSEERNTNLTSSQKKLNSSSKNMSNFKQNNFKYKNFEGVEKKNLNELSAKNNLLQNNQNNQNNPNNLNIFNM